ncbi:MAG: O-antigen ligase family protein [Solirubrobacteraceae bacterium]
MITVAALTGPLPKLGVVAVAGLTAGALCTGDPRRRATAILGALVLAPVLLLADIWHSPQLAVVHRHPLLAGAGAVLALAALVAVAAQITRRPSLFGALAVLALPFRIPIQVGGTASNLLVPLYLTVAAGSLAVIVPALRRGKNPRPAPRRANDSGPAPRGGEDPRPPPPREGLGPAHEPGWTDRLLALYVVLYGVQSVYSADFEKALQQMVFFYVPFALLYILLRRLEWTPKLIRTCLLLVSGLALSFAVLGFVEYATKTIILNPKLVVANDLHTYFTVNSVFFDPDIFGRFLALVMILLAGLLLYGRQARAQAGAALALAALWAGLVLTLSRSSLGALLVGLGTLAAVRWKVSRTLAVAVAALALGAAAVAISPRTFGLNQGLNGASSGRADLIGGGISLFAGSPVWGHGSASFVTEYRRRHPATQQTLAASHTIPVTIAAEQGVIGELAYAALVVVAAVGLIGGARTDPARAAVAAAFLALVFHTFLYADFLEDPVTWALLGVGVALAHERSSRRPGTQPRTRAAASVPV